MDDLPPSLSPGAVVAEKYELIRLLGRGGMGAVFEARHRAIGERVALKVMLPSSRSAPDAAARFEREARAAFGIPNDHVARVLDAGRTAAGDAYLVMELLEGVDLARAIEQRGPLPIAEAVEYVAQTAEALSTAHQRGIVHRDIKPANVFVTQRSGAAFVKVLDFGLAKALDLDHTALTGPVEAIGTIPYMSPEQLTASRDVDARADVWSLGVVLYELLTARRPFEAASAAELIVGILHSPAPPLRAARPDAPPALEAVVMHALQKNREARFASADALARAARAALHAPISSIADQAYAQPYTPAPHTPSPYAATMSAAHPAAMMYRAPAFAPIALQPARSGSTPLVVGGAVVTGGGVLTFAAAAIPGVVNGSEIGTAVAIGVAAVVAGVAMILGGKSR